METKLSHKEFSRVFYFYFSGHSLNSFPEFSILKFSGKFFQFGMFSIGTLLNIIPSLCFLMLHCTFLSLYYMVNTGAWMRYYTHTHVHINLDLFAC